jgi:AmmeMemoRadiSam system protein A
MSPSPEPPRSLLAVEAPEYSPAERDLLLQLAHDSIAAELHGTHRDIAPPTPHLAECRGAFTTLHLHGALRGCIGHVFATQPLFTTVAQTAKAAAFEDPRFYPVTLPELPEIQVELSVLSPLQPVRPEDVVIGRHGLVISEGDRRGLLLPQVPVEWNWDRETFLAQTCLKAGLPPDAWKHGARLQAFTAEVFGDR